MILLFVMICSTYHSIDLGMNYLAAVFEASMDFQLDHLKTIGCNPNEYINSGFLIMNLELMRRIIWLKNL